MEPTAPFHLDQALDRYLSELNRQHCFRRDDLAELKSHLLDQVDDWQALGLTAEEAWHTALTQLGDAYVLEGEYRKVNRWYSRGQKMLAKGKGMVQSKRTAAFAILFFVLTFSSMFSGRAADQRKPPVQRKNNRESTTAVIPKKAPQNQLESSQP
nr:Unknown Function [uncultured bacterium]